MMQLPCIRKCIHFKIWKLCVSRKVSTTNASLKEVSAVWVKINVLSILNQFLIRSILECGSLKFFGHSTINLRQTLFIMQNCFHKSEVCFKLRKKNITHMENWKAKNISEKWEIKLFIKMSRFNREAHLKEFLPHVNIIDSS